ncbi:MAG: hypothetical protein MUC81_10660 [Bacteroidia bacterium]|jgi:hypothetical protein|nr:hypothetical protein [Bacteroidia bacterium]
MKKYFYFICFLTFAQLSSAQPFGQYIKETRFKCEDLELNLKREIIRFYQEEQFDSIYVLSEYWRLSCPNSYNGLISLSIAELLVGKPTTLDRDTQQARMIHNLQKLNEGLLEGNHPFNIQNSENYAITKEDIQFKDWLIKVSDSLVQRIDKYKIEYHFLQLLLQKNYNIFEGIEQYQVRNAENFKNYRAAEIASVRRRFNLAYLISTGIWIPFGKLKPLGIKNSINLVTGYYYKKHGLVINIGGQFNRNRDSIMVEMNNQKYNTKRYLAFTAGFDYQYSFLQRQLATYYLSLGYHIKSAELLSFENDVNTDEDDESRSITGHIIGIGVGTYLFSKNKSRILGIALQQQFTTFSNRGGTPLYGHATLITLSYGIGTFFHHKGELKSLHFNNPY